MWAHANGSGAVDHADLVDALAYVGNSFGSTLLSHMVTDVELTGGRAILFDSVDGDFAADANFALSGAHTGDGQPAQVAVCASWTLARTYRGGHPRTYLPGVPAAVTLHPSSITGDFADTIAAAANTHLANVSSYGGHGGITSLTFGTVSFQHAKEWRTPPLFKAIVGASCDTRLDTQRRRLGKDR